jgi:hypothetical protein
VKSSRHPFQAEPVFFILILLAGAALRFYALGDLPHGIYHDEAYYGLDAVSVLEGARPVFFPANNGREPLYIYILSLSVATFGRAPFGLRFASAVIGALTMPVTYLLGRALFNRRVGLLAMAICAVTFWPLALSRVSFRAGALPLFLGLAIALGWLGLSRRKLLLAILGGAAYGLAFNTYTAARVTPLALGAMAVITFLTQRREDAKTRSFVNAQTSNPPKFPDSKNGLALPGFYWRELAAFALAAAVVVAPLGFYALAHPEQVFAREGQVSIFETESGNPVLILLKHVWLALGMFGWRGDAIPRHNLPGRPVFDLWTFIFFIAGLVVVFIRAWRTDTRTCPYRFVLVWLAATILPTVFAEDTPHFLRAIGMLPVLWLIPAVGLETLIAAQDRTGFLKPVRSWAILVLLLTASALVTARDYFLRYAADPATGYYFESAATDLATQINSRPQFSNRIDNRLWDNFASLRFLIPDRDGSGSENRVQLAVWPYEAGEARAAVAALPANSLISARRGELARGDLESAPYSLYTLFVAEPVQPESPVARFGDVIELRSWEVTELGNQVQVGLRWAASAPVTVDYHVYVHVLTGGEISAQSDGEPLGGLYHFSWLRPGDVLNDEYVLPKGDQIIIGLYAPDGAALGEALELK